MSRKPLTKGTCPFCGKELTRLPMVKHLQTCSKRNAGSDGTFRRYFDILIFATRKLNYWMIVQAEETILLAELDLFIQNTWFQPNCHLSMYRIAGKRYDSTPDFKFELFENDMNHTLKSVLQTGMQFEYEYDFGSTTPLTGIVVGERSIQSAESYGITKLVQNQMETILCENCGERPAVGVDPCGNCTGKIFWCKECYFEFEKKRKRSFLEYMYPVVNSPRMGLDSCVDEGLRWYGNRRR